MGEYVIVVFVVIACIGAATAFGAEVKVDEEYAACRVRNLWSDADVCDEELAPPDDDPFPLPDRASLPVPDGVWVRASDNDLPVRLDGVDGLSDSELAALLAEQGLTHVTDPDLLRAAYAISRRQTQTSEGRTNVESLYAKYGKDNITLVFQAPQTPPPLWKTLLRRSLPLAAADFLLGAVEAVPPDNFFGGPWHVDSDGDDLHVTRTRLEGGTDCLVLQDSSSRTGTACLAEGTESYLSTATGEVLATVGPMGPVLDHEAIRREATQLQTEHAAPWWWPFAKPAKPEPDYIMGVVVDPYRWVQGPDGKWINQEDGSVHDRPDLAADPSIETVLRAGRYRRQRLFVVRVEDVLGDMGKIVGRQVQGSDPDPRDPAARAWLALTLLTAQVQELAPEPRSATETMTSSIARVADGQGIVSSDTMLGKVHRAIRTRTAFREEWQWNPLRWVNGLRAEDWERVRQDVAAMSDVLQPAAHIAETSPGHTNRAARLAAALRAERLANSGGKGDREAAVATVLELAGIGLPSHDPATVPLRDLAAWWTEPLARRLPGEVANAIAAVIGAPGSVDAEALLDSLDRQRLRDAARALEVRNPWRGIPESTAAFASRGRSERATGDWLDVLSELTDIETIRSYLGSEILRASSEAPANVDRFDGMLNADGSRNWEAMVRRGLRRSGTSYRFHPVAARDRRLALTLAVGPRLEDFVKYVTDELNAGTDWAHLPRAGAAPKTNATGEIVRVEGVTTVALETLLAGPDPQFATALWDTIRVLAAYADKWALTQAAESFLEDELLTEATFAGREGGKSRGAINMYREILVEGFTTIAQAHTQLLGQEPATTGAEREHLAERLDNMRGPMMTIAHRAPFGILAPLSQRDAHSVAYDDEGNVVLPYDIEKEFGKEGTGATATGYGCPVAHASVAVCDGALKPTNSLDKLIRIFNELTAEALRRGIRPNIYGTRE